MQFPISKQCFHSCFVQILGTRSTRCHGNSCKIFQYFQSYQNSPWSNICQYFQSHLNFSRKQLLKSDTLTFNQQFKISNCFWFKRNVQQSYQNKNSPNQIIFWEKFKYLISQITFAHLAVLGSKLVAILRLPSIVTRMRKILPLSLLHLSFEKLLHLKVLKT